MKTPRLALAAVVVGLLASACSGARPYAAIVNGTHISQQTLLRELHALGANKAFVTAYDQSISQGQRSQQPVFAPGTGTATFTQGFTDVVLNTDVQAQLIHDEVVRRHIEPNAREIDAAASAAGAQFPNDAANKPVFPQFDPWFRHEYQMRAAEQAVLAKALPAVGSDDAAVQKFYDTTPQDFISSECVSHILVRSQEQASSIRARIVGGADFAAQAKQYSTDPGSAVKGGALGCQPPGQYVPAFERVADSITVGELSPPVQTQFGWHVIKVTSRQLQPLTATLRQQIQQFLQQESPINVYLQSAQKSLTVKVNPAYGTWQTGQGVVPPTAPGANAGVPTTASPATTAVLPGSSTPSSTP